MTQLTIRLHDDLVARLRLAADARGTSVNGFVVAVLDAATNPDLAGADAQRVRERLAAAGLLADIAPRAGARPSSRAVATARRAAGTGRRLADLVSNGRE